jgi:hypothetical protein
MRKGVRLHCIVRGSCKKNNSLHSSNWIVHGSN